MLAAELGGFLSSDFSGESGPPIDFARAPAAEYQAKFAVEVGNARELQAKTTSEAQCFAQHGFVLLEHQTRVQDWDRDIGPVYLPEVEGLIRERLLPGRRVNITQTPRVIRRGAGKRHYAGGVHSDGPSSLQDYVRNLAAFGTDEMARKWQQSYERDEVLGLVAIDFWRTTNMRSPLRHMPLALCEPKSVDPSDVVPTTIPSLTPSGRPTHHLALRFNPNQVWYYYPEMTSQEVIAFKMCEFWKADPQASPQNVFHTAFEDPSTPANAELRQSCEHRVGVMILRD